MNQSNEDFIKSLVPGAQEAQKLHSVPASVTIAQAILESSWGKSNLTKQAFNLFGIKADLRWKGESVSMPTAEYYKGIRTTINAPFRKYASLADSINDHAVFLRSNKRYASAFECKDGCDFAVAIARAGYATDPSYADLLGALIIQHKLAQYDA